MKAKLIILLVVVLFGGMAVAASAQSGPPTTGGGAPVTGGGVPPTGGGAPVTGGGAPNSNIVSISLPNPLALEGCDPAQSELECLVNRITKILIVVAFPIATLLLIWGAFQLMSSGGNVEKIEKGWATIRYTILGFVVLLLATLIVSVVQNLFKEVVTGTTPSNVNGTPYVGTPPAGTPPAQAPVSCSDANPTGSCPAGQSCLFTGGRYSCIGAGDR